LEKQDEEMRENPYGRGMGGQHMQNEDAFAVYSLRSQNSVAVSFRDTSLIEFVENTYNICVSK
jgi:hypothetical protein